MKTIRVSNREFAIIDDDNYGIVSSFGWWICHGYARTERMVNKKRTSFPMHHLVIQKKDGFMVDHINGNKLDNRRENLRLVSHTQNMQNQKILGRKSKSGIRGVTWCSQFKKYRARIQVNKKRISLGLFETAKEAHIVAQNARLAETPFSVRVS